MPIAGAGVSRLTQPERSGYVERRDDPHGARARSAYELTDAGEVIPLAETLAAADDGPRYPARVARLGADTYAYVARWLAELESELGA
jgi:hypothetical protein